MSLPYGVNITQSDMRSMLEQNDRLQSGVRTWRQLFGTAGLDYATKQSQLKSAYSDAIAEAYKSNLAQQNQILGTGLAQGSTEQLLASNRQSLNEAYQNYISNYAKDLSTAASDYSKNVSSISEALDTRAKNFSDLYKSAYTYLSDEISDTTRTDESGTIYNYLAENAPDWLYDRDEQGKVTGVRSWEDLSRVLFDENQNLTREGIEFYDMVFNTIPDERYTKNDDTKVRSFDKWLSDTNPELREWYVSADPYNFSKRGTISGTANVLSGRESTDYTYGKYEYIDPDKSFALDENLVSTFNNLNDAYKRLNDLSAMTVSGTDFDDWYKKQPKAVQEFVKAHPVQDNAGDEMVVKYNAIKPVREEIKKQNAAVLDLINSTYTDFDKDLLNTLGKRGYDTLREELSTEYKKLEEALKAGEGKEAYSSLKSIVNKANNFVSKQIGKRSSGF